MARILAANERTVHALTLRRHPGLALPPIAGRDQARRKVSRNSSTPWFSVVTKPAKLGFGMSHLANVIGIDPDTLIALAVRSADSVKVTGLACPCMVRFPVAV